MAAGDKRYFGRLTLVFSYSCLSILYFKVLDPVFYAKFHVGDILNYDISFALPVPYLLLTAAFIALYSYLSKESARAIVYPIIAMAMFLPLSYLLTEMRISMCDIKPFSWGRGVYTIYVETFYLIYMLIFSIYTGSILKARGSSAILQMPAFIWFIAINASLLLNGFILYSSVFSIAVFLPLLIGKSVRLFDKAGLFLRSLGNEKLFLIGIYALAFAIRYLWGARLLATVGDNFILASDDGTAYSSIAAMLARGETLPKATALGLNGFGYWYFLGALYKIFGAHNFKAIVMIQSLLGATVPVLTYCIAKRVFRTRLVSVIGSLITSFNLTLIFLSVVIGMESLYVPFFLLAVLVTVGFLSAERFDYKKGFVSGALFGLANNMRGELLLAPLILSIVILITKKVAKPRQIISSVIAIFLGFMMLASIQHVTLYRQYGEYHVAQTPLSAIFANSRLTGENKVLDEAGFNPFKDLRASAGVFLKRPAFVSELMLKGYVKRAAIFFFQPNFGVFDPIFLVNPASGYLFRYPLFLQLYGYIFIVSGILFSLFSKEDMAAKAMMLFFIFYIVSIYSVLFVTNSRCRGALIPITALFASYGITVLYIRARDYFTRPGPQTMQRRR